MQAVRQGAQPGLIQQRGLAAMFAAATGVFKVQGVAGFYTGYVPNILQVSNTAVNAMSIKSMQISDFERHQPY